MTAPEVTTRLPAGSNPDPAAAVEGHRNRYVILGVLCLALLVVGIDGTIVNVALPTLVRDVGASSSELQWIVDAYTIVFASFLLIAGNTGDRLGRNVASSSVSSSSASDRSPVPGCPPRMR